MREFLDRVTGSDDDGEEVELSPTDDTDQSAPVSTGPGHGQEDTQSGGQDGSQGRLQRQVASSQSDEVELSEAGQPDAEDAGSDGFLPGTGGTEPGSGGSDDHGRPDRRQQTDGDIETVIEQNKKIIGLLEQLVDEDDPETTTATTDAGDDGTPSLW